MLHKYLPDIFCLQGQEGSVIFLLIQKENKTSPRMCILGLNFLLAVQNYAVTLQIQGHGSNTVGSVKSDRKFTYMLVDLI